MFLKCFTVIQYIKTLSSTKFVSTLSRPLESVKTLNNNKVVNAQRNIQGEMKIYFINAVNIFKHYYDLVGLDVM